MRLSSWTNPELNPPPLDTLVWAVLEAPKGSCKHSRRGVALVVRSWNEHARRHKVFLDILETTSYFYPDGASVGSYTVTHWQPLIEPKLPTTSKRKVKKAKR